MNQLKKQLAECQARDKVLRSALCVAWSPAYVNGIEARRKSEEALALPHDSTALDDLLKAAKSEAFREAADWFECTQEHLLHNVFSIGFIKTNLRRMAHELQS